MIKLSKPYIPDTAIEEVVKVLKTGNLVQGEYVKKFEADLCDYLQVKNAIVVSSGTAALHLTLIALDIKEGDEVILPAFTYPATANVVEIVGAKTVLVDINLDDFCIDTTQIEKIITPRTKAIIPVHEFGQAAKIDEIVRIAKKHNLFVIEDAACALGTEFKSKKVGTFGEVGCFSFHPRKAITTGEGGAIITDNDTLANKLRSLRNHGIDKTTEIKFDFIYAGLNYRMTDFQAALGLAQLNIIEEIIAKRIDIAKLYDTQLEDIKWLKTPGKFTDRRMVYQTYHILVNESIDRDQLISYLKNNDVETNYGAYALNSLSYYKEKYKLNDDDCKIAYQSYKYGIALPLSYEINDDDINYIVSQIKSYK